MSLEALWSLQFASNQEMAGGGVIIFETGRVFGGDHACTYVGNYSLDNGVLEMTIHISRYNQDIPTIFGDFDEFDITLTGKYDGEQNQMEASGFMNGDEDKEMVVICNNVAALP